VIRRVENAHFRVVGQMKYCRATSQLAVAEEKFTFSDSLRQPMNKKFYFPQSTQFQHKHILLQKSTAIVLPK
jgi:hypothetical protein